MVEVSKYDSKQAKFALRYYIQYSELRFARSSEFYCWAVRPQPVYNVEVNETMTAIKTYANSR